MNIYILTYENKCHMLGTAGQWRKDPMFQKSFWNKISNWVWTTYLPVASLFFMLSSYHHHQHTRIQSVAQLCYFYTYVSQNLKTSLSFPCLLALLESWDCCCFFVYSFVCFNVNSPLSPASPHSLLIVTKSIHSQHCYSHVTLLLFKDDSLLMIG